jgi:hypothetical protein
MVSHRDLVLSDAGEEGRSLQALAEMWMASSMAASNPLPPSPLRAGPKHSGRRISSRTTTLAFSSTLSPTGATRCQLKQDIVRACLYPRAAMVQSVWKAHSEGTTVKSLLQPLGCLRQGGQRGQHSKSTDNMGSP